VCEKLRAKTHNKAITAILLRVMFIFYSDYQPSQGYLHTAIQILFINYKQVLFMKFSRSLRQAALACTLIALPLAQAQAVSAVQKHGALSVKGNQIVDKNNQPASLAGPSLFWSNTGWGAERYYNADVVAYVQKNWNASIIRAAIGADNHGGYLADPQGNLAKAERVIDAAIAQGIYVIVDWHAHDAEKHPDAAIEFFAKIAEKYGATPNVIYEIYNEPLNTVDWATQIKPYAEKVIGSIRAIDADNLIIVGTQTWSQDVDKAAADPIKNIKNIAYTLHFYAGTHKQELRDKAQKALDAGIALMVTEWGTVDADGNGAVNKEETNLWLAFMRKNNLSHCNWALHDKKESASQLKNGTAADGKWSDADLTESGLLVKNTVLHWDKITYSGAH
jgi:aryl-phospho-beta-D-glucosidase BglC (GH1 family)